MRYDVKKFLFIGVEAEREAFFKKAQEVGVIHFVNTKTREATKIVSEEVQSLVKAIKILRGLPVVEQEETEEFGIALGFAQKIINIKKGIDVLDEEDRVIKLEMSRVEVFGDFSMDDIAYIETKADRKIQFYCAKNGYAEKHKLPNELIYLNTDHGLDYFIGINRQKMQYPKMIEMEIDRPWNVLNARFHEIEKERSALEKRLKGYAKYNKFMHDALIYQMNRYSLDEAKGFVAFPLENGGLFAIEGWVPVNKIDVLQTIVADINVYMEEINIIHPI